MAMILDAFASSLGDMLIDTMKEESSSMLCISDEIRKLYDTLNSFKKFLHDAEKKHITSSYAQDWVRKLKGAMYEASDIADLVQIKSEERRISMVASSGCFHSLLLCLQDPLFAHRIGSQIKLVNQKMDELCKKAAQLNFITNLTDGNDIHKVIDKMASGLVPRDAVGKKLEQDTKMLVDEVLTKEEKASSGGSERKIVSDGGESNNVHVVANSDAESNNVTVVAILGIGGIGKTTLAKKIYSDRAVEDSFNTKIWFSVTQDFNEVDLLRTAIVAAGGDHCGAQEKSLLEPVLISALMAKKFLLVMDDIWNQQPWEKVLRVPTIKAGARGSRVLITTRNGGVAREMNAVHLHHVRKLGPPDACAMIKEQLCLSEPETKRLRKWDEDCRKM